MDTGAPLGFEEAYVAQAHGKAQGRVTVTDSASLRDFVGGKHADEKAFFLTWQDVLEQITGATFEFCEPVLFAKRSVPGKGTNYSVKYKADDQYIHAKLFRPLPGSRGEPELLEVTPELDADSKLSTSF